MRMILAVALVAVVAVSGQAQAPSWDSLPAPAISTPTVGGVQTGYEIKFADGSVLKADTMRQVDMKQSANGVVTFEARVIPSPDKQGPTRVQMFAPYGNEGMKPLPHPVNFDLSGNVRLIIPVR